jgi:hypothetical protein
MKKWKRKRISRLLWKIKSRLTRVMNQPVKWLFQWIYNLFKMEVLMQVEIFWRRSRNFFDFFWYLFT